MGVDAPEMRAKCQREKVAVRVARQFSVRLLRMASVIELKNIKRGKYFRLLADVYIDGKSLAENLIGTNHGRVYRGGKRLCWCDELYV